MLVDDVKLDLVSRVKRAGRREVSVYCANYDSVGDWNLVPGWLDGREVLAVFRDPRDARPGYFVELTLVDGRVAAIRDFRYVPHVAREAAIELAPVDCSQRELRRWEQRRRGSALRRSRGGWPVPRRAAPGGPLRTPGAVRSARLNRRLVPGSTLLDQRSAIS